MRPFMLCMVVFLVASGCETKVYKQTGEVTSPVNRNIQKVGLYVDPDLPEKLSNSVQYPPGFFKAESQETVDFKLAISDVRPVSTWIYALVAPFPTVEDGISLEELRNTWEGKQGGDPLLLDESTLNVFTKVWGEPGDGGLTIIAREDLLDYAWSNQPSRALLSFEDLEPRWKVLEIDGQKPIDKNFDASRYPLKIPVSLEGEDQAAEAIISVYGEELLPKSNREEYKLSDLAMTGVTALVRATAFTMENEGVLYPGKDIRDWLRSADLTHISNEVSFADDCPYPNPVQQGVQFCSDPDYIKLLEDVGADIVELSGDHIGDWGEVAVHQTLEMYRTQGWETYAGGANLMESRNPVRIEVRGNRIAFIGCNAKDSGFTPSSHDSPGASSCTGSWMQEQISQLKEDGYLPVVTFQHNEYYTYEAQPDQIEDFREMADSGAVIVSGSQAHQPQAFEFYDSAFIHYGLGNLFFDQYDLNPATRQGFIDRHVFYAGKHISTELLTIVFMDYARPRPMNAGERRELLEKVFAASRW